LVSLFSHIGLGDLILLSGAIVTLLDRHSQLRVYCYSAHEASVCSFFAAYPGIEIVPVPRGTSWYGIPEESALCPAVDGPVLRSGSYAGSGPRSDLSFPELFYRQLGLDYKLRWAACPLERAAEAVSQLETEIPVFVHDDPARGFHILKGINAKPVYRPLENGGSILAFVNILRKAKEIHCIDSSFYHLVESLDGIEASLYYHRYPRYYVPGWFDYVRRYKWQVLP
jgi:hypothetical protein